MVVFIQYMNNTLIYGHNNIERDMIAVLSISHAMIDIIPIFMPYILGIRICLFSQTQHDGIHKESKYVLCENESINILYEYCS